ncbi:MAG: alpha/beta fold hydrolase [Planctomycetota bacterium]
MMFHHQIRLPPFQPHPCLRDGHLQTLATAVWPQQDVEHQAVPREVDLGDGDAVVVHDDLPPGWTVEDPVAILSHGLCESHRGPLISRLAARLVARGVRVFRWDMRGCGAGMALARRPYHAGCSDDLQRVVEAVVDWCGVDARGRPSPIALFGVSLSGNVLLKYLGENGGDQPERIPAAVRLAIAVNPPIDLLMGVESLASGGIRRVYDRYFVRRLLRHLDAWRRVRPDAPPLRPGPRPRSLWEFDDRFTAPALGFPDAEAYYRASSACPVIGDIRVPTVIITSQDDPLVPAAMFAADCVKLPEAVRLVMTRHGGHVGYIGRRGTDPDRRWLDWRVVDLVTAIRPSRQPSDPAA